MKEARNKPKIVHVLLMEDEGTVAHLVQLHLQSRGFAVDIAEDGEKGLDMYYTGYYDVLILDHKMPKMSGLDVIRELKQRGPLPPILLVSGLGRDDVAVDAMNLGAMDYIVKDASNRFLDALPVTILEVLKKHEEVEASRREAEERSQWMNELKQRVRELGCLYGIEKLFASEGESIEVVLQGVANLIPRACRHADLCYARISMRNMDFRSDGYEETRWRKSFVLKVLGRLIGTLEVGYRTTPPPSQQDIFSAEEYELLHAVADRLSQFIDRWYANEQLRQIHDELRKLSHAVEQSASAILITDEQGRIEYVNPAFCRMTGYDAREVIGQTPRLLKSGEKSRREYRELWEAITAGREWRGEFHNRRKDGSLYWDYSTISPVTDPEGKVTHYVAVKQDITDRKEAEQLRAAVLSLSAAIAGCQTEDEICRVIVEGIRERMGVDRCGLFLGDPRHPPFRGTYGTDMQGRTTDERGFSWDITKERDVTDLFGGLPYKSGFPLGAPEAQPGEEGITSTLIALRQSGEVFGVISVDNRLSRRTVSEAQMLHIALLAEVVGNALQVARTRGALRASVEETRRANEELEAFNLAMVGREGRVIELKDEVNRLLAELERKPKYPPVWETADGETPPKDKA